MQTLFFCLSCRYYWWAILILFVFLNGNMWINGCTQDEFTCNNGRCIPTTYVCDRQRDCSANEDELECHCKCFRFACPDNTWQCQNNDCIPNIWRCDGIADCPDETDEVECSTASSSEFVNLPVSTGDSDVIINNSNG